MNPPLRYDFRVYQPYFADLCTAAERRRLRSTWTGSAGFRIKQVQPVFAHASGSSSFFYFHTCCSSLAPVFLNALRRTSVSRLEALAVTAARIEGCKHEFYSIAGVREDIVDDIFNGLTRIIFKENPFTYVPAAASHRAAAPAAAAVPPGAVLVRRRRRPPQKQLYWREVLKQQQQSNSEQQEQEKRQEQQQRRPKPQDEEQQRSWGQQEQQHEQAQRRGTRGATAAEGGDRARGGGVAASDMGDGDGTVGNRDRSTSTWFVESETRGALRPKSCEDGCAPGNAEEQERQRRDMKEAAGEGEEGEKEANNTGNEANEEEQEEEEGEYEYFYRIPNRRAEASFEKPLRAQLRVRGPLAVVAGLLQLPPGVEILNKNEYLFTVDAGYYVNMDIKIERIREYVLPESGYNSLQRDVDTEGYIYFPNFVSPVPVFAFAAERRGEAVHTTWRDIPAAGAEEEDAAASAHATEREQGGREKRGRGGAARGKAEGERGERQETARGTQTATEDNDKEEDEEEEAWQAYVPGPRGLQQVLRDAAAAAPAAVQPAWCKALLQQQHEKARKSNTKGTREFRQETSAEARNSPAEAPTTPAAARVPAAAPETPYISAGCTGCPGPSGTDASVLNKSFTSAAHESSSSSAVAAASAAAARAGDSFDSPLPPSPLPAAAAADTDMPSSTAAPSPPSSPASSFSSPSSSSLCAAPSSRVSGIAAAAVGRSGVAASPQQQQQRSPQEVRETAAARAYEDEYLSNDLPYQNLGEVVTLEIQTDGSITPREALVRCCDDLTEQTLLLLHALRHNCHAAAADGNDEEEFEDPDWYQDAHRYIGVPWNPYKKPAARTEERQQFFFRADVIRQYNLLREKMDARREAAAAAAAASQTLPAGSTGSAEVTGQCKTSPGESRAEGGRTAATAAAPEKDNFAPSFPLDKRKTSVDYYVATQPAQDAAEGRQRRSSSNQQQQTHTQADRQQDRLPHLQWQHELSKEALQERLLDEEEEEEKLVNRSVILRKEREEAWRDKQRMYRELAENERLKFAGDGKGMPRYPLEDKLAMKAPDWVLQDPMGPRMPLGYSELEDD